MDSADIDNFQNAGIDNYQCQHQKIQRFSQIFPLSK
jgi:hypothetical protein